MSTHMGVTNFQKTVPFWPTLYKSIKICQSYDHKRTATFYGSQCIVGKLASEYTRGVLSNEARTNIWIPMTPTASVLVAWLISVDDCPAGPYDWDCN